MMLASCKSLWDGVPPMTVPLPSETTADHGPPSASEVQAIARGLVSAIAPPEGLTHLQGTLVRAVTASMTGFSVDLGAATEPIEADDFARLLARRDEVFRLRVVQLMLLGELVLVPLPAEVVDRVERFAAELGVADGMLRFAHDCATDHLGLAMIDFERNGYTAGWDPDHEAQLHTSHALAQAWDPDDDDPALAARWAGLEDCRPGSLGESVVRFYRSRGFLYPGLAGSAPPYLAQHDWVHVVADYGTTVESEIEVFGLIARAIPDPRGFSLLAMVVGLFETGYLPTGAGLFEASRGHLSTEGMADRLGDAMRRGAMCGIDLMAVDWFALAERSLTEVRAELGIVAKSAAALAAGSVGPWEAGGISPFQLDAGRRLAERDDRIFDAYGARPT